jgi:hypothetical protein
MNKAWPALASATYIGCAGLTLHACTDYNDLGLFATPPGLDAGVGTSGPTSTVSGATGTVSSTGSTASTSSGAGGGVASSASTGSTATGAGGATGGAAGAGGAGGPVDEDGGAIDGGRGGAGGGSIVDGAAGSHGGGAGGAAGSAGDAGVPPVCVSLHASAQTAKDSAQACMQAGSFTECRLVQDECGCGVGVRGASAQAIQRYLMAVQTLKDNGCFDACPDTGCPPYAGAKCTPGTQSRLQCIAY